jgi:RNA recognition motif
MVGLYHIDFFGQQIGTGKVWYTGRNRTGLWDTSAADPVMGRRLVFLLVHPEKAAVMEVTVYVGNLPRATTGKELTSLFSQAGDVTEVDLVTDRFTGGSRGYAYITMSAQSEADRAVSIFNTYQLEGQLLKVALVKPREQRGFSRGD